MDEIYVIRGATTYDLYDYAQLLGYAGFGASPNNILAEQGPLQHGETYRGLRLLGRPLSLILGLKGSSWANLQTKRQDLLGLFSPDPDELIKLKVLPVTGGQAYQIDCQQAGDLDLPSADQEGFYQRLSVGLFAPGSTWYDPTQAAIVFGITLGANEFEVPMDIPLHIGASVIDDTRAIDNEGTWEAEPIIEIEGPITNPKVENLTTGEVLDFTGLSLGSGNKRIIDTRYGYKTVEDENGASQLDDLADDDLATFHLERGLNSVKVTGTGGDASTQVYIRFYIRFIGI